MFATKWSLNSICVYLITFQSHCFFFPSYLIYMKIPYYLLYSVLCIVLHCVNFAYKGVLKIRNVTVKLMNDATHEQQKHSPYILRVYDHQSKEKPYIAVCNSTKHATCCWICVRSQIFLILLLEIYGKENRD